jgi:hypothetical protein
MAGLVPAIHGQRHRPSPVSVVFMLLLFLGIRLTAVGETKIGIKIDCENRYLTDDVGYRLTDDAGAFLTWGDPQYWLIIRDTRIPIPLWADPILEKFFVPSKCR